MEAAEEPPRKRYAVQPYSVTLSGRTWSVLNAGLPFAYPDEDAYISQTSLHLPYGVALWPAALALAEELDARGEQLSGKSLLELGAGTGLPGLVAADRGARVVQTDNDEIVLMLCGQNAVLNRVGGVQRRLMDWTNWRDEEQYDLILGADILYMDSLQPYLAAIFRRNLAPGGCVLLADSGRPQSRRFLDALPAQGWRIRQSIREVCQDFQPRSVGLFELRPAA